MLHTLVLLGAILLPGDERTSLGKLRTVLATQNQRRLPAAVRELAGWNSPAAMKGLLALAARRPAKLDPFWMEAYPLLLRGAAAMTLPAALDEGTAWILKNKRGSVARDFLAMLCNQGRPEIVPPMIRILQEAPEDMRVLAAEHLAVIGDKRCVPALLAALRDRKAGADLRTRAARALALVTGRNYGEDPDQWAAWWERNQGKELKGPRVSNTGGGTTVGLDRGRDYDFEELKKGAKVLVLGAGDKCRCGHNHDLDQIQNVAAAMGLQVDFVDKVTFEKETDPAKYIAILANCTHIREHCACPKCKPGAYSGDRLFTCVCPENRHEPVSYVLGDKGVRKLKTYVEQGGYLFAEDWCMEDFVEKAFGRYVRHGSIRPNDEEVKVVAAPGGMSHPYLKKIFFKGFVPKTANGGGTTVSEKELKEVLHTWKIDKETRTIKIVDPKRVAVLLSSPDLEKYAQGDEAVAVTFAVGGKDGRRPAVGTGGHIRRSEAEMTGGRVLYVLSHFGKQKSQKDEYALQNLLINFLMEAYARARLKGRFKK